MSLVEGTVTATADSLGNVTLGGSDFALAIAQALDPGIAPSQILAYKAALNNPTAFADLVTKLYASTATKIASLTTYLNANISGGGSFTAGGDLSGSSSSQTVIAWLGEALDPTTMGLPTDGQIPVYVNGSTAWKARSISGDISMSNAGAVAVGKINGASVPAAGSLTTGNVLQVSGVSALSYGPLNLAGGANYVTGLLPKGNQASQDVGGDLIGTTAAATVAKVNGTSVPATPAANSLLQATSTTAAQWTDPTSGTPTLPFANLQNHHIFYWCGLNTTSNGTFAIGFKQLSQSGTQAEATPSSGSKLNGTRRTKYTVTSATSQLGIFEAFNGAGSRYAWRGDAAGRGGFKCVFRFAVVSSGNNSVWVHHYGLDDQNGPGSVNYLTNTTAKRVMLVQAYTATAGGAVPAATNWKISECDGTTNTLTDTGIAVTHGNLIELILYCTPNGTIQWTVNDITAGTTASGSCTTTPPATTVFMAPAIHASITTGGTGTCEIDGALMYGELFD